MKAAKSKSSSGGTARHRAATRTSSSEAPRRSRQRPKHATGKNRRWIASVTTVSTCPPPGLFTKDASTIARTLASKKVSPKGPASGLRMLMFFINRAGKGLKPDRRAELEKAKELMSKQIRSKKKSARETD